MKARFLADDYGCTPSIMITPETDVERMLLQVLMAEATKPDNLGIRSFGWCSQSNQPGCTGLHIGVMKKPKPQKKKRTGR